MDIYIKPKKKAKIVGQNTVKLKDVADVFASKEIENKVNSITLLKLNKEDNKKYLITVMDIIKAIDNICPGNTINNVGETDTVIEYQSPITKKSSVLKYVKIFLICIVVLFGSSTAIMSFHSDAQMAKVFENYYYIFFNEKVENPMIIDLPYSIGLAIGIIVFFNHFTSKKLTKDPTPIEVELTKYETDVIENLKETLDKKRESKK